MLLGTRDSFLVKNCITKAEKSSERRETSNEHPVSSNQHLINLL